MSEFIKTIKENIAAIVTSMIVLLLVLYYIFGIVPNNERAIDQYNQGILSNLGTQFNNTLNDYATQIDLEGLKKNIHNRVEKALKDDQDKASKNKIKINPKAAKDSIAKVDSILMDAKNNIIIQTVTIDSIKNAKDEIVIYKEISLNFSTCSMAKHPLAAALLKNISVIADSNKVEKLRIVNRLNATMAFQSWMIYTVADQKKNSVLESNINMQEYDSLVNNPAKQEGFSFKFSDKRFYKRSYIFEKTANYKVMLIGGVSNAVFDTQKKRVDIDVLTICILVVLLLFLSIPLIKPLISSTKERLTQMDLLSTTTAIGILTITIVCFCLCICLFHKNTNANKHQLEKRSKSIMAKFAGEFSIYRNSLDTVAEALHESEKENIHSNLYEFPSLFNNKVIKKHLQNYFNFNSDGDVVRDICTDENFVVRKNFSERSYFKVMKDKYYSNMLTAVYSKYDNKYKLVYVKKDHYNSVSGFAYAPQFMDSTQYDNSYGYLLCYPSGEVILHSDTTKRLNENILQNSRNAYALTQMFHGFDNDYFEINYNGNQCLFYRQKLDKKISDFPVFLLTYKQLDNTNKLKVYTIVDSFILSLAYSLGITLLGLLYSVFYYAGDVFVLSRFHFYWLFPDNSRSAEYTLLKRCNYFFFFLFIFLLLSLSKTPAYYALLVGINLAFFNFVILNQREFLLDSKKLFSYKLVRELLFVIAMAGFILPALLYYCFDYYPLGLCFSLLSHFAYLALLKKGNRNQKNISDPLERHPKVFPPVTGNKSLPSNRSRFISFFSSVICYHYLLIPAILTAGLFCNEMNKQLDYYHSSLEYNKYNTADTTYYKDINEPLYATTTFRAPPSKALLNQLNFDVLRNSKHPLLIRNVILNKGSWESTTLLVLSFIAIVLLVRWLINFYSGRFFFYELSEAYRIDCFRHVNGFSNFEIIIPLYNESDFEKLDHHEQYTDADAEEPVTKANGIFLKEIPADIVSNQVKLDLIMNNNFETYKNHYQSEWDKLNEEEKFVMNDFAVDHFVNYKNRNVMIRLMKKGYIIADPLTGRLRVMNYGFRNFIINIEKVDPESAVVLQQAEEEKGTFAKWKLPIIIVALSILLLLMYIFKSNYDQVLLLDGSIVSALGLIGKFMNGYKD